eukprot:m.104200 g.104200  ORF g.104200 m.104200 type:complete len:345 (+) comp27555_c0_seq2:320-1354(+)
MLPPFIAQGAKELFSGQSSVTLALVGILSVFFLLGQFSYFFSILSITPGNIIPPHVHIPTLISGGFLETNLIVFLVDLAAVLVAGNLFESLWGTRKYLEFVVVINIFGCLFTATSFIVFYIFTSNLEILFLRFNGYWCVLAAYLVGFKQVNPSRKLGVKLLGVSVDCRLGPVLYCGVVVLLWGLNLVPRSIPVMALHGTWASWTYLRFYQTRDDVQGDPGESFAFADLFPTPLQPAVTVGGGHLYRIAVSLHLIPTKPLQYDLSQSNIVQTVKTALPGATLTEAERRRQAAERDLQKRLLERSAQGDGANKVAPESVSEDVVIEIPEIEEKSPPKAVKSPQTTQ